MKPTIMTTTKTLLVPDIGDFKNVPVIEILVRPGDAIRIEDALLTLESDKATIDVPSAASGIVGQIRAKARHTVLAGTAKLVKRDDRKAGNYQYFRYS